MKSIFIRHRRHRGFYQTFVNKVELTNWMWLLDLKAYIYNHRLIKVLPLRVGKYLRSDFKKKCNFVKETGYFYEISRFSWFRHLFNVAFWTKMYQNVGKFDVFFLLFVIHCWFLRKFVRKSLWRTIFSRKNIEYEQYSQFNPFEEFWNF